MIWYPERPCVPVVFLCSKCGTIRATELVTDGFLELFVKGDAGKVLVSMHYDPDPYKEGWTLSSARVLCPRCAMEIEEMKETEEQ